MHLHRQCRGAGRGVFVFSQGVSRTGGDSLAEGACGCAGAGTASLAQLATGTRGRQCGGSVQESPNAQVEVALGALAELRAIASLAGLALSLKLGRTDDLSRHGAFVVSRFGRAGCGHRRLEAFASNRGDFAARIRHQGTVATIPRRR